MGLHGETIGACVCLGVCFEGGGGFTRIVRSFLFGPAKRKPRPFLVDPLLQRSSSAPQNGWVFTRVFFFLRCSDIGCGSMAFGNGMIGELSLKGPLRNATRRGGADLCEQLTTQ